MTESMSLVHRSADRRRELSHPRGFFCPSLDPASWITSAVTVAKPFANSSVRSCAKLPRGNQGDSASHPDCCAIAKLFFLPKYSPDQNPIEQVFAKLKHLLRRVSARAVDAVCTAIGRALDAFMAATTPNIQAIEPNLVVYHSDFDSLAVVVWRDKQGFFRIFGAGCGIHGQFE
ncbi:transposase [Bradyrhizobium manausense]|uniref:Tc1-like transposase DDE domain-containing protein n=1 Tax=Bradyrhizobium manausense TaxID=989370 RepID=A0A0R3D9J6_9BRAD|nr:hypothetical protein AOQ71_26085 [Bradyrhizobium manausense]